MCVTMDDPGYALYLFVSNNSTDLTSWGPGMVILQGTAINCGPNGRTRQLIGYPTFVGSSGSPSLGWDDYKLYYAEDDNNSCYMGDQKHVRMDVEFETI